MKKIRYIDNLTLPKASILKDSSEYMSDLSKQSKKYSLLADIRATHSGYLLNGRVYMGKFMKAATDSWTKPYNRPVLLNHEQRNGEPIGRVVASHFTQTKQGDQFDRDYKNPDQGNNFGSGFITLKMAIKDKDAIEKVLDGRYSTVSTAHRTENSLCSICGTDWEAADLFDMPCDHMPGHKYEKDNKSQIAYLINTAMTYDEVSFVNVPAQQNVAVLSLQTVADSGEKSVDFVSSQYGRVRDFMLSSGETLFSLVKRDGMKDELPSDALSLLSTKVSLFVPDNNGDGESNMKKDNKDKVDGIIDTIISEHESKKASKDEVAVIEQPNVLEQTKAEAVPAKEESEAKEPVAAVKPVENKEPVSTESKDNRNDTESNKAFETALKAVADQKEKAIEEARKLQSLLDAKTNLCDELNKEIIKLKSDNVLEKARQLAISRINLGKPGTESIDSKEKFDAYVDSLSKRSVESLRDSLSDILPELNKVLKDRNKTPILEDKNLVTGKVKGRLDSTNAKSIEKPENKLENKETFLQSL